MLTPPAGCCSTRSWRFSIMSLALALPRTSDERASLASCACRLALVGGEVLVPDQHGRRRAERGRAGGACVRKLHAALRPLQEAFAGMVGVFVIDGIPPLSLTPCVVALMASVQAGEISLLLVNCFARGLTGFRCVAEAVCRVCARGAFVAAAPWLRRCSAARNKEVTP